MKLQGRFRLVVTQQFLNRLRNDVFHDVAWRVINSARFSDFRLFLDGHAASLRTDDLAKKSFVNRAEYFHRDVIEEVRRFLIAQICHEPGQPAVSHHQFLAEMRLEQVAVEERNMGRRTAIQRAEMPDDGPPERIFGSAQAGVAKAGRRFLMQFQRLLVGANNVLLAVIALPGLHDRIEQDAGINIARFADAQKKNAVQDALDGFVELVALQQVRAIVVADQVKAQFAPCFVQKI